MKKKCLHLNRYLDLGGTINRLTGKGIETEIVKGKGLRCLDCKAKLKIK